MILLTHCAGNIYIFSFIFVSQFPAFFRSNYAKFLMCVCVTVTATLMSKMVLMITTVRTLEVITVTQYFNLQHPFSLISNYSNLFFSILLAFPLWAIVLIVLVAIAAIIGASICIRRRAIQRRAQRREEEALAAMESPKKVVR